MVSYPFSLAAEAESTYGARLLSSAVALRAVHRAHARLRVLSSIPYQEHIGQMWDVTGG